MVEEVTSAAIPNLCSTALLSRSIENGARKHPAERIVEAAVV